MPKRTDAGPEPPADQSARPSSENELLRLLALGAEHEAKGQFDEAEGVLVRVLASAPDNPQALHLAGIVDLRKGRLAAAIEHIERAVALKPETTLFQRNLCELYRKLGRYDDALAAGRRAAELDPADQHVWHNLSVLHYHRLELDAAIECAERAIALDPTFAGAHFGIAEASLLRGDFARGWEEYQWRFRLDNASPLLPPTDRPRWDGKRLQRGKTLLLIADQGYGDAIQFARYIGWAASRCRDIAVACSRELHPIIAQQPGVGQIFHHWSDKPDFAAYCALSGLPRLAAARLKTIPAPIPYLRADSEKIAIWAERLRQLAPKDYRWIGIVWAGRSTHTNDDNRSATLAAFAPLANLSQTALLSLQKGEAQAQIGGYWGRAPLINLGPEIGDFADTMALLECLELVVTVDTAVAHLAGAMGKRVWLMLPYAPDWRWLLDRTDSPWYPSARLFRQTVERRWEPVIAAITAEIARSPEFQNYARSSQSKDVDAGTS